MHSNMDRIMILRISTFFSVLLLSQFASAQLDYKFYDSTCPNLTKIIRYGVWLAIANETRMAASILRLHFHDCFVDVTCCLYL